MWSLAELTAMKFFAVIVAFISLYDAILCVTFKDCGSTDGTVSSVSVKGCSSSDARCIFKTGTDEEITIQFKSSEFLDIQQGYRWGIVQIFAIPNHKILPNISYLLHRYHNKPVRRYIFELFG